MISWIRKKMRERRERWAREVIDEGRRLFGSKWCPICSFAQHVGHCAPEPHDCPRGGGEKQR